MGIKYIIDQVKGFLQKDEEEVVVEDLHDDFRMRFLNINAREDAAEEILHELIDQQGELKVLGSELWDKIREEINGPEVELTINFESCYVKDNENNIIDKAPEELAEQLREVCDERSSLSDIVTMIRHKVGDLRNEYTDLWEDIKKEYDIKGDPNSIYYDTKRNSIRRRPNDE